jgi:predicted permease
VEAVTGPYFELLGMKPVIGRVFLASEHETPGTHPVVLLSHGFWQRRFGGDPAVLGQTIGLNHHQLTVVGVLPEGFKGLTGSAEVWVPMMMLPTLVYQGVLTQRWAHWFQAIGRVKEGVPLEQARRDAAEAGRQVDLAHPGPFGSMTWGASITPYLEARVDASVRTSVLVLFGAVAFVLLIASVNIANLMLARAAARQRELAIRTALGARRSRIVRQLLTESVLLALVGGTLGLLLSMWGVDFLAALWPRQVAGGPGSRELEFLDPSLIRLDWPVILFGLALSAGTGLLFGAIPALKASGGSLTAALKEGAGFTARGLGSLKRLNARGALVIAEVALALVLLVGAGLMIRSFARLRGIDPGFDARGVLTLRVAQPRSAAWADRPAELVDALLERVGALPGVRAVGADSCAPFDSRSCDVTVVMHIPGHPTISERGGPQITVHTITPDQLDVLRVPLLRGRRLGAADRAGAPLVAMLNETAARQLFPGEEAIGRRIRVGIGMFGENETAEIVGIVGDVRYVAVHEEPKLDIYVPYAQYPNDVMLHVRTDTDPASLAAAVRREVLALDPDLPVFDVRTLTERSADATARTRVSALLLGVFASLALVLAALGIYGVIAYSVAQRTHEMGLRMALGARRGDVVRLVVRQGMTLVLVGIAAGLAGAFGLTRLLASMLYGVRATDPATFAVIALLLTAVAFLASWLPARRATRVDPSSALRSE